ncbi:hypothetical protein Salat_2153000 [Sesamum alatum]|uniref:GRF-type domain-containing protein n=1 Tax=Sesamum alatum TaxID=300844 RepID=A0AAE1Y2R4_9LAMI|nr:hypothetical protein Salat_2153000 [Sesamum alatum]
MSNVGGSRYTPPRNNSSYSGQSYTTSNDSCHAGTEHRLCECGNPIVTRTSWTILNPGRRFRGCSGKKGSYCSTFEWVDQPGCQRCVEVISGLIRRLSRSTANEKAYEDRIRNLEAHVRFLQAKLYVVLIAAVVTYVGWFASRRMP